MPEERERKLSPTPFSREGMSNRDMLTFLLERSEALQVGIADVALTVSNRHGEFREAVQRLSYVAQRLDERDQEREEELKALGAIQILQAERIDKIERRMLVIGATCTGAGAVGGLLIKLLGG